jgi:hypothetical protein
VVICKRKGGEYAWSSFRINQRLVYQASKRRSPVCIGCEQTARDTAKARDRWRWAGPAVAGGDAESEERPKKASTDTRLSDVGISYDQSSGWQKLAAAPEEIFEREVQDKTHMPTTTGLIRAGAEPNQRPVADGRGGTDAQAPNGAMPRHAPSVKQGYKLLMADRTRDAAWIGGREPARGETNARN